MIGLLPATAAAQSAGVIAGTIRDAATQAPLADVAVTATSPVLPGEQTVVSDSSGAYRVPQLPPGVYTLRFEREGFRPYAREGIEIPAGYTLRMNVELLNTTTGAETIVVVGKPPVIDVGSAQQGGSIDRDFIRTIPVAPPTGIASNNRSFENLALTVPGARVDRYGVSLDGATSPENSYRIDGLSTRNPGFGVSGSQLSVEFVESVDVTTGGYMPEYGRTTGGIIAANTRSGGDEFHGSIWGTWTPGALAGTPHPVSNLNNAVTFRTELHNIVDFGATLGGYLVKDRLWFFFGIQPEFSRYRVNREITPFRINSNGTLYQDEHGQLVVEPPIYSDSAFADEHQVQYVGKLDYLINQDHRLSLTVTGTPSHSGGQNAYAFQPREAGIPSGGSLGSPGAIFLRTFDGNFDVVGKLSSSFADKRVLLDIIAGWHHEDHNSVPADGSKIGSSDPDALVNQPNMSWGNVPNKTAPGRSLTEFEDLPPAVAANCQSDMNDGTFRCRVNYATGGPGMIENHRYDSLQLRSVLTLLFQGVGHHILKLGADVDVSTYDHTYRISGGSNLIEYDPGDPIESDRTGILVAPDREVDVDFVHVHTRGLLVGSFLQDSWSIADRVTLNAGVRYDTQTLSGPAGKVLSLPSEWSPRIGVVWDFTQQGRSKVYANYARYYENVPLDLAARSASGAEVTAIGAYKGAVGPCSPRSRTTSPCQAPGNLMLNSMGVPPNPSWFVAGANEATVVDPTVRPPTEDEIVAGVEYELLANTRASLEYHHRNVVRWVEDMSTNGVLYFIGNPGEGVGFNYPAVKRVHDSVTAGLNKSFADLWLAQVSYTWQHLHGNLEGLFRNYNGQLDPNILSDFDIQRLTVNRDGPLPGDIRHTIKAYISKEWVLLPALSITSGVAYVGASGAPIDFLGANGVNFYGNGQVFIFPRGSGGRLPWHHQIDINGALNFRLSQATVLSVLVNVFNLFNFQQVTGVSPDYTLSYRNGVAPVPNGNPATDRGKIVSDKTGQPLSPDQVNPNFLQPVSYQPIRQVRFQARLTF
jgi:outer membrane receptor protein involved in Fe transport